MQRLSAGTVNPPNKVIRRLNTISATCITTATVCLGTESGRMTCSRKLPLRATRMLSGRLSVPGRGFQSTQVRGFRAFNKSESSLLHEHWTRGMAVDVRRLNSAPLRCYRRGCEFRKSLNGAIRESGKNRGEIVAHWEFQSTTALHHRKNRCDF